MKHLYFRLLICSLSSIAFLNSSAFAHKITSLKTTSFSFYSPVADDVNLVLSLVKTENSMDVHISFNGNEGAKGTLKIINAHHQLVHEFEIDLVHAPNFSTININEYQAGVYTFELTTGTGIHASHLTIK